MPTAFASAEIVLGDIVDLDTYPIHDLSSPVRAELVAETQKQMTSVGCALLPAFVPDPAIATMFAEAQQLHDQTFWSIQDHNPYFSPVDESLPVEHPNRFLQHRESGFINSDVLLTDSLLRRVYDSDVVVHFIFDCLGTNRPIYRWADPLGRNPYGVMEPGHYLPWHFDGNEFTISILVNRADEGGIFEYVPNIRRPDAENAEHVRHVLDGGRDGVRQLDLIPGDLQIFAGRYSMHRVTRIVGDSIRYIALPTYVHDPYRMNRPFHSESIYGRATDLHHARAGVQVDGLGD